MFYYLKHKSENLYDKPCKLNTLKHVGKFFPFKEPIVNISGAMACTIRVIASESCSYSRKAARDHT